MPVVEIRALPQQAGVDVSRALTAVCRELAATLGEEPSGTWATWETLEPGRYAEGESAPAEQPRSTHPPLVRLRAFEGRSEETAERMLTTVAGVLAQELDLEPGNVFVVYDEALSGRIFDGGAVVRRS